MSATGRSGTNYTRYLNHTSTVIPTHAGILCRRSVPVMCKEATAHPLGLAIASAHCRLFGESTKVGPPNNTPRDVHLLTVICCVVKLFFGPVFPVGHFHEWCPLELVLHVVWVGTVEDQLGAHPPCPDRLRVVFRTFGWVQRVVP